MTQEQNNAFNGFRSDSPEHLTVRGLRVWQTYFGERFQMYGRSPHVYVFFGSGSSKTPEGRRRDAASIRALIPGEPFAVVSFATEGAEDSFLVALARKGVLTFAESGPRSASFFNSHPKLMWSVRPLAEQQAAVYGSYVCSQVVGRAPVLAGEDLQMHADLLGGGKRSIGMIRTSDPDWEGLQVFADLVHQYVQDCGGSIDVEAIFPDCCLAHDGGENPGYAYVQMAEFKQRGITTILWPGGINGQYGVAAAALGYRPEWILAGDGYTDANFPTLLSKNTATFDGRALVVTPQPVEGGLEQQLCYEFYREIDQSTPREDLGYTCDFYRPLHQLMVGIQLSGPFLGPTNMSAGFHAIPHTLSADPTTPACFYETDDYTCIKDAQAEYWSATGLPPGSKTPGCWRPIDGGLRHRTDWPNENLNARITGSEPCNGYSSSAGFDPA